MLKHKLCEILDQFLIEDEEFIDYHKCSLESRLSEEELKIVFFRKGEGISYERLLEAIEWMEIELFIGAGRHSEEHRKLLDQECPKS